MSRQIRYIPVPDSIDPKYHIGAKYLLDTYAVTDNVISVGIKALLNQRLFGKHHSIGDRVLNQICENWNETF